VIWLAAPAVAAAVYYLLAIIATARWPNCGAKPRPPAASSLPVSILKPVHGRDPHFFEAIRSHALQDYPEYEILFGVGELGDPAVKDIRRLMAEFPDQRIRLVIASSRMPNPKVGVLADLAAAARYPLLLASDSDIRVEPDYLRRVTPALDHPGIGLVTCFYRAQSDHWPARWQALGVATEFVPSVLVAELLGAADFAFGSTLLLRAEDLRRVGGFAAVGHYLADDYQLARLIRSLGMRVALAPLAVDTYLGDETWAQAWRHQLRWSRTIRVSRPGGYCGYIVTHATLWSLVALLAGAWPVAAAALAVRLLAGICTGSRVLRDSSALRQFYLIPLRDLWGFAVWVAGLTGGVVEWRGARLKIASDGTIVKDL
jgi:ceramide glucosyltransferase